MQSDRVFFFGVSHATEMKTFSSRTICQQQNIGWSIPGLKLGNFVDPYVEWAFSVELIYLLLYRLIIITFLFASVQAYVNQCIKMNAIFGCTAIRHAARRKKTQLTRLRCRRFIHSGRKENKTKSNKTNNALSTCKYKLNVISLQKMVKKTEWKKKS